MRLVTFNILHGRSPTDGRVDLDRYQDVIRALDPDVLAVQEVDRDQPRSHGADLTALAADAMGAREHRFAATLSGTPGESWVAADRERPGTPEYGIALLSRFPAVTWQTMRLPRIPMRVPVRLTDRVAMLSEEPRVALVARLDTPRGPLTVAATHLAFVPGGNQVQLWSLRRRLAALPGPLILLGDLNLSPRRAARITGYRSLADRATFPADRPSQQIDHILARDADGLLVHGVDAPQVALSDHRPLLVDVSW